MKKFSILFAITFIISSCSNSKKLDTSKLPTKIGTHAAVVQEEFIYKLDERLTPQCHASTI